ncbi:MAG: dihydroneopterin aldolase [Lentisphaeria bacterium]|nr:dihydroneopterin aldolase [Lentisphaeria bacterium]
MATITVSNLRVNAIIGTLPDERIHRQNLILTVEFAYDARRAAATDDLTASVDYSAVERAAAECAEKSSFFLVEALAGAIAGKVLAFPGVERVKISIAKPGASALGALITYTEEFFREDEK